METNEYLVETLVREKLAEARAATARRGLILRARPPCLALRRARASDDPQIAAIWNDAIGSGSLTTDTEPRTPKSQRAWRERHGDDHPLIVAADGDEVLAYGSLSPYRDKPAFRVTVEDSVYVRADRRRAGFGSRLLAELLRLARARAHHAVMARIVADNETSRRLHERLGFALVGVEQQTAFKQGRWLDIAIMQRLLDAEFSGADAE
jgi:L-amino acid N-acyltransferase